MKPMERASRKQPDEKLIISDIFRPGTAIDVVFHVDEDIPIVRSSIIHDCDYKKLQMIISQTTPRILPSFKDNTMSVTTIVEKELNERFRCGIQTTITEFLSDYTLTDQVKESAILITYEMPAKKVNIRSAYRLEPGYGYKVSGNIVFRGEAYPDGKFFTIKDISFTGMGIKCPVQMKNKGNPLFTAEPGENASIEIQLETPDASSPNVTISSEITIVRKKLTAAKKIFFLGMKFSSLKENYERILSKFIHEAQIRMIKRDGRR